MGDNPEIAELQRVSDIQARALETVCTELRVHETIWARCAASGEPGYGMKASREEQWARLQIQEQLRRKAHKLISDGEIPAFAIEPGALRRHRDGQSVDSDRSGVNRLPTGKTFWRASHIKRAFVTDLIPNGVEPAILMVRATDADTLIKNYLAGRRQRRGPIKGTVDRYSQSDRALFPEIDRLMCSADKLSLTAACKALADNGRIKGGPADPASLARRLRGRYKAEREKTFSH